MPRIRGVGSVSFLSEKVPPIPIIVTTAHGNFSMAVEILHGGAVYFMIEFSDAKNLLKTIRKSIHFPRTLGDWPQTNPLVGYELNIAIPADYRFIEVITYRLVAVAESMGFSPKALTLGIPIAVDELIANAIFHGAREDPHQKIFVHAAIDRTRFRLTVRDEGKGFDPIHLSRTFEDMAPPELSGRGIQMVYHYMDSLIYNAEGNEVRAALHNPSKKSGGPLGPARHQ